MKPFSLLLTLAAGISLASGQEKPNIVFVITDDQGYGDLAHNGHPYVKTPAIDKLHSEGVALDDYHVAPTCSPTRCGLLTGHWTNRTGVWHTVNGRSMLRENEITIATLLKENGYTSGLFGKWHLGDNYPYRPEDRGFDEVYRHGGGGVGQTPDLWNNNYFDGHYFHNGEVVSAEGFCTDVFFDQGIKFIKEKAAEKKPFLAFIATNAPHTPLHCPQEYLDMYSDQPLDKAAYYGMVTNIDDNVARTRKVIEELGIADNTIFIFTTDNGTVGGADVYNAGMRGQKGSPYEGGHRVPFIIHWPAGKLTEQKSVKTLTGFVDIVPTLLELTGSTKIPADLKFDGKSIKELLYKGDDADWEERYLITDSQRVRDPIKWRDSSVMSQKWRLINGTELYDITADPGQENDVAAAHPEQVQAMRQFYEDWWAELEPTFSQTTEIYLGHPEAPVVTLTGHDWIQEELPPWNQGHIRHDEATKDGKHEGHWAVKVIETGIYTLEMRRWPKEADTAITAGLAAEPNVPGADKAFSAREGDAFPFTTATIRMDGKDIETKPVSEGDTNITFTAELTKGSHQLAPVFTTADGKEVGAYYLIVSPAE
ncbi:arylsulfatase [Luteolibacter sp. AS25]|uniref:arylsulfatase n=1 Tax=Luteolibacter sp. AS25 TaxID=3135776 RepID=UPI00398A82B5